MESTGTPTVGPDEFETLGKYWLQLNRRIVAPRTTERRLTSLKSWARYGGINAEFEFRTPTAHKTIPHPLPGGIDDVYKLIDCARGQRHKAAVAMMGLGGCRVGEAVGMRASNYDLADMLCNIRGKGDKERIVPIGSTLYDVIIGPLTDSFCNEDRAILLFKDRYARQMITDLGVRAKIKRHITSHDLRSTFATHVFGQTNNIRLVQELLGHASVETTQLYTAVFMKEARAAVDF
jgi:site-specific recombinase XerD